MQRTTKRVSRSLCGLILLLVMCTGAWADVAIDAANFPDDVFREYVSSNFDKDSDDMLNEAEIAKATEIYIYSEDISSLQGVEYLAALTKLTCERIHLMSLDVSQNVVLEYLNCGNNQLTELDVSKNTALTSLRCIQNQLAALDVSKNTALQYLDCGYNQLRALDVSNNTTLADLRCNNNQLTELGVTHNTALTELWCSGNQLTSLDVSQNTSLTGLDCADNQLTAIDLSKNTALWALYCQINQLTALSLNNNTTLVNMNCGNNQLTELDVSKNTALEMLWCYGNQLTKLDVSNNTALTNLECYSNQLRTLDVSHNTALTTLSCGGNQLTELDVSHNTALTRLACGVNQLTELDVSHNTALTRLACGVNQLTMLDVSKNTALTRLECDINQLTKLDVSKNTALTRLSCYGNQLTTLELNNNTALTKLDCHSQYVSPLIITSSGNTSYPYQFDLSGYMSPDKFVNVSDVQALDSSDVNIAGTYFASNGIAMFESRPAKVTYKYNTGYTKSSSSSMDVTISDSSSPAPTPSPESVAINATNFPDDVFRAYVSHDFDTDRDGVLSEEELAEVTQIEVAKKGISLLQGVEYFTSLVWLRCSSNQLTSLDVSNNAALTELDCSYNQLKTLTLSNNAALVTLECQYNRLTSLDVSKSVSLDYMDCSGNALSTLDVSKNTALTNLDCSENQLTSLNVSNNIALTELFCNDNQLTTLNLSKNTALTHLNSDSQNVSSVDITATGDSSYPYQLDFSSLMTSENFAKVSYVWGLDSSNDTITATYSDGIAQFEALPVKVTYYYATGYTGSGTSMDVTLSINTPDTPTPAPSSPYYERGNDGNTQATAYLFTSQEDLTLLRDRVNNGTEPSGKYYKLNADIDLTSETDWKGIGNGSDFSGHFDGQGHAVIVSSDCPLFWIISTDNNEVAVENLKICGNVINLSSSTSVAALASQLKSGIISSCDFSGNVQANGSAGGLLDWISGGIVINCAVGAEMSAGGYYWPTTLIESLANDAGGIVSYMSGGVVSGCVIESGTIVNASSDLGDAGGIVGFVHGGTMRDCVINSFAEVTGGFNAGGIVGFAYESQDLRYVRDCRVMSNVAITASNYAGGIAGSFSDGAIENCRVEEGTVITGTEYGDAGGIVSRVYNNVTLSGNSWPSWSYQYPQYVFIDNGNPSDAPYYRRGNDGNSWETAYVLSSPEDLIILQERVKSGEEGTGKYYKLSADIDMTSVTGWYGIGRDNDPSKSEEDITRPFTGHVDGQNHTVYANPDLALFGAVRTANDTIAARNLNLYGYTHYSPLAFALRSGIIENCNFSGTVETKGIPDSSGLISFIFGGTVRNCGVKADIHSSSGSGNAGGIVAYLSGGTIENCVVESGSSITASADASATADLGHAGGIVGVADAGTIENCTVQTGADITASRYSGGIVGYNATASGLTLSGNSYPSSFREVGNRANPEPTPAPVPTPEPTPEPTPTPVPAGNYYDRGYNGDSWENAYTLVSKEDFLLMASRMRSGTGTEKKYHKLDADIDLSDQTTWEPLAFSGYFDGQGHAITLNIDRSQSSSSSDVGASFFLTVDHVSNLRISGNLKGSYAAGIVHVLNPDNVVENCSFDGTIEATEMNAGGIVDEMRGGTVRNCAVTGKISSAKSSAGGIAGNMTSGTIEQCSVGTVEEASRVAGYSYTGGIAAQRLAGATESADVSSAATEGGYVKDCSANVELTNGTYRGGIVGRYVSESSVDNSDVYLTGNTWPDAYKQVGIVHDGGTIVDPDTLETGTNTVPIKLEVATISPVVVSDEVLSNLATLLSVDVSEIKMLTSDDIDSSTPPEPTAEMRRIVGRDNGIFLAKFNTLTVKEDGYYVFMVTVSDDLVGTSVGSLRAYAAEVSDFSAGSFSASFSFLPLINGVAGNLEVTNLLGLELDTLPKQFLMTMFLSASKSITVYLVKILLMLLAGCDAGLGVADGWLMLIAGSIIVVKAFKKKR